MTVLCAMAFRADLIYLLAAALFFYAGYHQFYLGRNVDRLERAGRLTPDTASRVRRKPMRLIGSLCLIAGAAFLLLGLIRL
jgi:hypothetical protein